MIKPGGGLGQTEQPGELIKSRNFHGAGPGKLLFHTANHRVWQLAAIRSHQFFAIRQRRRLRIHIQGKQSRHPRHDGGCGTQRHAQNLIQIGSGIGAHEQHPPLAVSQGNGRGAGERRFAHATFAGEKQEAGGRGQKGGE